jgi:hypothetical protein
LPHDLAAVSTLPYSLLLIAYSQQQEQEADVDAVVLAARAGYHPKYDLAISDRMGALEYDSRRGAPPVSLTEELGEAVWEALKEYFRTHPSWPDRIREIIGVLRRNESDWSGKMFYVGRSNHAERVSWTSNLLRLSCDRISSPLDTEIIPRQKGILTSRRWRHTWYLVSQR